MPPTSALSLGWLALVLCASHLMAGTPAEFAERRLQDCVKGDVPGVAVLVARDGRVVFQGAYGLADVEKRTPVALETKFRIGSVTKQFTAAAILRLADEGKLAITDSLAKYYPDFPKASAITLRHLLTHTSGLHSYTDKPAFMAGVSKPITPAELIASFQNDPPDFAPGSNFRYCNSGYFLLGEIAAKVSGQSFADYLRTAFFEPLEMKDTGILVNATPPPATAHGYAVAEGKATLALDWDMSWAGGAGALYSTVGDLLRWNEALHGGRVLKPESLRAMTTANPLPSGANGLNYGFGLTISEVARLPAISHSGGLHGWSSDLMWLPEQRLTVVALANAMPAVPGLEPASITRDLVTRFLAEEIAKLPAPAEDKTVDPKSYAAFVGRYDYQSAIQTVTVENDRLFAQLTGQERFEIFPKSADEYFFKVAAAQVVFLRNEKGEVVAVQHTQNGNTFRAPRLAAEAVALTVAQLDEFVGRYQYGPGAVLTVKRDGTQLSAQLTGQPALPIFATAEDSFEWRIVPARVRFAKGDDGKVSKAVHTQNGVTFDAPKIK
jgi:CubicO group peptidase (beta-lactamase class C family)